MPFASFAFSLRKQTVVDRFPHNSLLCSLLSFLTDPLNEWHQNGALSKADGTKQLVRHQKSLD